jgi:hypothetical protein
VQGKGEDKQVRRAVCINSLHSSIYLTGRYPRVMQTILFA